MKKIDFKHAAFHAVVAVYFLWLIVFTILVSMSLSNALNNINPQLNGVFLLWILLNLFMGTVLFIVIKLFKNKGVINKVITASYVFMFVAGVVALVFIKL